MDENIIKGIVYSQFDEKLGPAAVIWMPYSLSNQIRDSISMKSINIMGGESGKILSTLSVIPFPSINSKGLVKSFQIRDRKRRGGLIDSSITLLFREINDLIFYKYYANFEAIFEESATKIVELEEAKAPRMQVAEELTKLYKKVIEILKELQTIEIISQAPEYFPKEKEDAELQKGFRFKIIVCGDPEVGKTSIVLRFTNKAFRSIYIPTIGVSISEERVYLEPKNAIIEFIIWDIAGRGAFQMMRKHFYTGADGVLLIFDLTRALTFTNLTKWFQDIKSVLKVDLFGFILGNKSDLAEQRIVNSEEIEILAKVTNLEYIETSALSGENINKVFYRLADILITQCIKHSEEQYNL
ncbi:MAG: GTP-binding protein [Candidatus Helarchaeota archaeon]|nr:GTP-binding protein [Candidatus Helarchaeota archaeon]